jgi:hypothetical protein
MKIKVKQDQWKSSTYYLWAGCNFKNTIFLIQSDLIVIYALKDNVMEIRTRCNFSIVLIVKDGSQVRF